MIFGISDKDLYDKNKLKIIDGIAGAGKSSLLVSELESHGDRFCLASFSNALKFAAADRFGCECDTICGCCFTNTPYPRAEEKDVTDYKTVILDECILDGMACLKWAKNHVGSVNIIMLTDSHQMLAVDDSGMVLKEFQKLAKLKSTVYVQITETKRARDEKTKDMYNTLFNINSDQLFDINDAQKLFDCDVINFADVDFDHNNAYICHSNKIEHEVYKRYDLMTRRDIPLIPKNHISRNRSVDFSKYPIVCQQVALEKRLDAFLQPACCGSVVRFQGREVDKDAQCYFLVEPSSLFTGRELYTVGTRCQSSKSIHIVIVNIEEYKGPEKIREIDVVKKVILDLPDHPKTYKHVSMNEMAKIIKQFGEPDVYYSTDYITNGENIIYSTWNNSRLNAFADINEDPDNYTVTMKRKKGGRTRTIKSVTRKDSTMHFDFMDKVYDILKTDVNPPRIQNPKNCNKSQFTKLCDIFAAFPTVLHYADMPAAGPIYTERSDDLFNFYKYKGHVVTNGSLIDEELANKLGDSEYMFSTNKQKGCQLGHYTYNECFTSVEKKKRVREDFLWGELEGNFYEVETLVVNGEVTQKYVKHERRVLELVACALWSKLCCIMLDAVSSIKAKDFVVVTDGLFYNGETIPKMPEWCDYRIDDKQKERLLGKGDDKYGNVIYKTYEDLPTENQLKVRRRKQNNS